MIMDAVLLLLALLATYCGMGMLALANSAHWGAVTHRPPPERQVSERQKFGGSVLLAASLIVAVVRDGWSFGLILGLLLFAAGAALVSATLTKYPLLLRWLVLSA